MKADMSDNSEIPHVPPSPRSGDERFRIHGAELPFVLGDFWRWSASDLLSNAMRGLLAEFLVAQAVGADLSKCRDEWGEYDILSPEGIRIEVKSAAYLQTWKQRKLSRISFGIRESRYWDARENHWSREDAARHSDVYVFCLFAHKDRLTADPLDLGQWRFYVVPTKRLDAAFPGQKTLSLSGLEGVAEAVGFGEVGVRVRGYL